MTKIFSLMSLIGLFSVLSFTQCKKKSNDTNNTPSATVLASTLTDASYGWAITGLTADKPVAPSVPTSTDWYKELYFADIQPTFMFNADSTYLLSEDISYIATYSDWSLNTANTALTIGGLVMKITESSDTKIVGTIAFPYYGFQKNETANLTITLTKNTEQTFPLANTTWIYNYPDSDGEGSVEVKFVSPNRVRINFSLLIRAMFYNYTYNSSTNTGNVIGHVAGTPDGTNTTFSISGNQLTINTTDGAGNPTPFLVLTKI